MTGLGYGMELVLTGSAEHLTSELAQAELFYIKSPGYDGADTIEVCAIFTVRVVRLTWISICCSMSKNTKKLNIWCSLLVQFEIDINAQLSA